MTRPDQHSNVIPAGKMPAPTEAQKRVAQTKLVNISLRIGVEMMFEHAKANHQLLDIKGGHTPAAVMERLEKVASDTKRITQFDKIARANGFDLEFKSGGVKSAKRMAQKAAQLGVEPHEVSDHIRLSAFSSDLRLLNVYAKRLKDYVKDASPSLKGRKEDWQLKPTGALFRMIKCDIDGINGEMQLLPTQQAHLASRITHHFYQISRDFDALCTQAIEALSSGQQPPPTQNQIKALVKRYNAVATVINQLASNEELELTATRKQLNRLLRDDAFNSVALDKASEGANLTANPNYSDIFKSPEEVAKYRKIIKSLGKTSGLTPMPILAETTPLTELKAPMMRFARCAQVTYAGYMHDAPEELRDLWVRLAQDVNQLNQSRATKAKQPYAEMISSTLIDVVAGESAGPNGAQRHTRKPSHNR